MREGLIIILALIGAGFVVYIFDSFRYQKNKTSKNEKQSGSWDALWAFLVPLIGFVMAIWFMSSGNNKARAKTCVIWALAGMAFNAIWFLLFN